MKKLFLSLLLLAGIGADVSGQSPGYPLTTTGGGGGATIASTTNVLKGDGVGNGVAAVAGTDFVAPAGTLAIAGFGSVTGTLGVTNGGNGLATATLGDIRYGSGTNALAALAGNITTTRMFLRQTGNGSVSAAPAWDTVTKTDVGLANVANVDTTNAANISSGTLPLGRLSGITTAQTTGIAASGANSDITSLAGITALGITSATDQTLSISTATRSAAASTQAGNPLNLTGGNATAGTTNAGAAAGGNVVITAGNAARLTSGNGAGGDVSIVAGTGVGTGPDGKISFNTNASGRWNIQPNGHLFCTGDIVNDIGASGANRPRDVYVGRNEIMTGLTAISAAAPTIASAATIAPTTQIVFISGTTAITTITAPSPISAGGGQITLIPTGAFTTGTTGNIAIASTAVVSKALIMTYDATTTKWYPSY